MLCANSQKITKLYSNDPNDEKSEDHLTKYINIKGYKLIQNYKSLFTKYGFNDEQINLLNSLFSSPIDGEVYSIRELENNILKTFEFKIIKEKFKSSLICGLNECLNYWNNNNSLKSIYKEQINNTINNFCEFKKLEKEFINLHTNLKSLFRTLLSRLSTFYNSMNNYFKNETDFVTPNIDTLLLKNISINKNNSKHKKVFSNYIYFINDLKNQLDKIRKTHINSELKKWEEFNKQKNENQEELEINRQNYNKTSEKKYNDEIAKLQIKINTCNDELQKIDYNALENNLNIYDELILYVGNDENNDNLNNKIKDLEVKFTNIYEFINDLSQDKFIITSIIKLLQNDQSYAYMNSYTNNIDYKNYIVQNLELLINELLQYKEEKIEIVFNL